MLPCDICGSEDGGITIPESARFRNMRIACWEHYCDIEMIRSDEAYKAYKYGKKDWHDKLILNTARRLKPLYRSSINNPFKIKRKYKWIRHLNKKLKKY